MVNLKDIKMDILEDIYKHQDFMSFWYYNKEEKKRIL